MRLTALGNSPGGTSEGATLRIAAPITIPTNPPTAASTRLSVRICETIRRRLAPSAERTANSRVRDIVRARSRFATLAQHISSTKPTTASSKHRSQSHLRAYERLAQRLQSWDVTGVRLRVERLVAFADRRHVALRHVEGHTLLDATDRIHVVSSPLRGIATPRVVEDRPETRRLRTGVADGRGNQSKPVGHDADDGLWPSRDRYRSADQRWIGAEPPSPESFTQNDTVRFHRIRRHKRSTGNRRHPKNVEEARRLTICDVTCSAAPSGPIIATLFARNAAIASNDWF